MQNISPDAFDFDTAVTKLRADHAEMQRHVFYDVRSGRLYLPPALRVQEKKFRADIAEVSDQEGACVFIADRDGTSVMVFNAAEHQYYNRALHILSTNPATESKAVFDHEAGHMLTRKGMQEDYISVGDNFYVRHPVHECAADTYMQLKHIQDKGFCNVDLRHTGWNRIYEFLTTGAVHHLSTFTLDYTVQHVDREKIRAMRPDDIVTLTDHLVDKTHLDNNTTAALYHFGKSLDFRNNAAGALQRMAEIITDPQQPPALIYIAARFLEPLLESPQAHHRIGPLARVSLPLAGGVFDQARVRIPVVLASIDAVLGDKTAPAALTVPHF